MIKKLSLKASTLLFSVLIVTGIFSGCELDYGSDTMESDANNELMQKNASTESAVTSGDFPIVLVHGFIGWGRDEAGGPQGHYYWGGYDDLQQILTDSGHECYTGTVGPFSSNWDRACELYAQIKGVRTDYGLAHSTKHNHNRFGKDFTGRALLTDSDGRPDWGKPGMHQKIHLIAHSQGGHTVRILAQLLENGYPEEMQTKYPADMPASPLFTGSTETKNLVHSITTMAATHNGTTLANSVIKLIPMLDAILCNIVGVIGIDANDTLSGFYDFKLQHFGIKARQHGESLKDYMARMKTAVNAFAGQKDSCVWDLSPEGAKEQNAWVHAQQNIYYFSFACESTHKTLLPDPLDNWEKHHVGDYNNPLIFLPLAPLMGAFTSNDSRYRGLWRARNYDFYGMLVRDRVKIDSSWWENDGIVNTKTMNGPWLYPAGYAGVKDQIVAFNKNNMPEKGIWYYGGKFSNVDHFDIIGLEILKYDRDNYNSPEFTEHAEDWYMDWADYLRSIE